MTFQTALFHDERCLRRGAAHFCRVRGPHFCLMKITEDVRKYDAAQQASEEERYEAVWQ